ncbi:MAG: hypothetical protein GY906_11715 [bacterium]|nr:hypothetical protein [bacterium]
MADSFKRFVQIVISFAVVVLVFLLALSSMSCSSAAPVQQFVPPSEVETVDVVMSVHECKEPPLLPELLLPVYPDYPGWDASEERKAWYIQVAVVTLEREAKSANRAKVKDDIINGYRKPPD